MPRLQKQSVGKIKGKEYSKWVITLPEKELQKAGFKEGEELVAVSLYPKQITLLQKNLAESPLSPTKRKLSKVEKNYREAFMEYMREAVNKRG